jgi:hypothetical protein
METEASDSNAPLQLLTNREAPKGRGDWSVFGSNAIW